MCVWGGAPASWPKTNKGVSSCWKSVPWQGTGISGPLRGSFQIPGQQQSARKCSRAVSGQALVLPVAAEPATAERTGDGKETSSATGRNPGQRIQLCRHRISSPRSMRGKQTQISLEPHLTCRSAIYSEAHHRKARFLDPFLHAGHAECNCC